MSSLRRLFPGIALTCKGILLFMCGAALIALFAVSPVIFGCVPSVVSETDSGAAYPAGALVYHRYTPAETLAPGDAAVVYDGLHNFIARRCAAHIADRGARPDPF